MTARPARKPVLVSAGAPATSVPAKGILHTLAGDVETVWQVPEEVPVSLQLNSEPYAVMMATPADFEDFAIGFAIAEGIVRNAANVARVLVLPAEQGYAVDLSVAEDNINRARMARRSLEGRTGCGLCGITEIADAIRMPGHALPGVPLRPEAVARAYEELPRHQPMSQVNRTVHAAAWCSVDGEILLSREDVGRHNALDKLIGAMARGARGGQQGFVLMSSRCSFELVQKCAIAGIGALATVSAPTALALSLAREAKLKLAALSNRGVMIFDKD